MSTPKTMALPRQALHRRRMIVYVCAGSCAAIISAFSIAILAVQSEPGPLLLAIDELKVSAWNSDSAPASASAAVEIEKVDGSAQEAIIAPANANENETEPASIETVPLHPDWRIFNGRPIKPSRTMPMEVTAYSPDARSCGQFADGITASGYSVWTNGMKLAAADTNLLPFGTLISVPGYDEGNVVPVLDRGGAIKGNRLDMLYPTHETALQWGRQKLEVTVWEYADGKPNDFVPKYR